MKSKIFNKSTRKAVSLCLIAAVIICLLSPLGASAASFSGGSGTKKDPYLIKTAEDVNNIRNNLSAHYKLAATIDMSKIGTFEPIGCFDPFTGSLTCDLGSNGLPKYAISNLKVYNSIGEDFGYDFASANYAGYGEEGVHYYASLFGKTEGATIKNIFLFDVDITNTVVGQHAGVGGYFDGGPQIIIRKQVDDQGTAALVTFAYNTTISGCGATGKINAKTNATAGLVARLLDGSSLVNSWADMQINAYGFWAQAGLVGFLENSKIDGCMSKGSIYAPNNKPYVSIGIRNPGSAAAGLVCTISNGGTVTNSYSEVCFKSGSVVGSKDNTTGSFYSTNSGTFTLENCYAIGTVEGGASPMIGADNANNCWVLNTPGVQQGDFKGGSAADIKAAFANKDGWDTSGDLPKRTALVYVTAGGTLVGDSENGSNQATSNTDPNSGNAESNITSDNTEVENQNENEVKDADSDGKTVITEDFEASAPYIVLFVCFAAVTVAISAFSVMMLLKTVKQAKAVKEAAEEEVDIDEE